MECPQKPNCVSTQTTQKDKKMDTLSFNSNTEEVKSLITKIVLQEPRTQLIKDQDNQLHFTFKSRIFGFVDDVEFLIDPIEKKIHFRSASRTGYSDLGVNRKRMTKLSQKIKNSLL